MSQNLSSAAVVIGALRVKIRLFYEISLVHYIRWPVGGSLDAKLGRGVNRILGLLPLSGQDRDPLLDQSG